MTVGLLLALALVQEVQTYIPAPPPPPPPPKPHAIVGPGELTCANYLAPKGQQRLAIESWLTGYLTALNQFGPDPDGMTAPYPEFESYESHFRRYCARSLEKSMDWAARQVIDDLLAKQHLRRYDIPQ